MTDVSLSHPNLRKTWQDDAAAAIGQAIFIANVTSLPGSGRVGIQRSPSSNEESATKSAAYSPAIGDRVLVATTPKGGLMVVANIGAYSAVPLVSSLPTAGATYRGVLLRTAGATGVADGVYACLKSSSDTYSWVRVDNTTSVFGVLGTATNGSSQSGISIDTAITGMSISATAPSSCYLRASFVLTITPTVTGGTVGSTHGGFRVTLRQDGTEVAHFDQFGLHTYAATYAFSWVWFTGGSHTWTLTINDNVTSSTTIAVAAGGNFAIEAVNAP